MVMKRPPTAAGVGAVSRLGLVLSALVILWCPRAAGAQEAASSIEVFLKTAAGSDGQLGPAARGDLNGDGLEDWAGVIHRRRPDSSPTYQLYVLLRSREGGYRVAGKTREEEIAGAGCCWVEDLQIRRSSIYIQNNAKTGQTMEAATHQFKLHGGEWRLVGLRIYYTDHNPDAPATKDTDMNLLTGSVVEKRQQGEGKPTVRRLRRKFPASLLRDFDFSNMFGTQ